jgi:hypothetical protein
MRTAIILLLPACVWRASVSWLAVANGQSEKAFASVVVAMMLAVSSSMLFLLLSNRKKSSVEMTPGRTQ